MIKQLFIAAVVLAVIAVVFGHAPSVSEINAWLGSPIVNMKIVHLIAILVITVGFFS